MSNIARRLGLAQKEVSISTPELVESNRNVGIEIEVENINPNAVMKDLRDTWEITHDGSLRPPNRSAELRSPKPGYSGKALVNSIDALATSKNLCNGTFGWRAALHLHIDMRDKDSRDLHMAVVLYSLLEPYIFAWDGTGRHESRFCMPWWVCSSDMATALNIIYADSDPIFKHHIYRFSKYTALNLAPLMRFGTVEFRHAQSTIDRSKLLEYINIALDIVNARNRKPDVTPSEMVLQFISTTPEEFLFDWVSDRTARALLRAPKDVMPLIQGVFERVINTAITLAEMDNKSIPIASDNINALIQQT